MNCLQQPIEYKGRIWSIQGTRTGIEGLFNWT